MKLTFKENQFVSGWGFYVIFDLAVKGEHDIYFF
jgi:hypothetical protein